MTVQNLKGPEDMILVSVDDHTIEPKDAFDRHMPAKYRDKAPKLIEHNGKEVWTFNGELFPTIGLNAVAGRPKEEYGMEPTRLDQMRAGTWDVHARVKDMDANGVLGSICFPTFPHFAGKLYTMISDKELSLAALRAYNDWHLEDWCGAAPGRFIPLAILPLWDIDLAVAEAKRMAARGVHAISFPDSPSAVGLPGLHGDHWDPLWKVCQDNKMVVCAHIGTGAKPHHASPESPIDAWIVTMPISITFAAADWLFSPIFFKFPELKLALSEGGIGWIPYFLERCDYSFNAHKAWTNADFKGMLPSELFRRNVLTCFIDDRFGLEVRDKVGIETISWECDYPHSDTTWPHSPEILWESIGALPSADINAITHLNVMREYNYDPFSIIAPEKCTVGALRAQSKDVDTAPRSMGGLRPASSNVRVTSAHIQAMLADEL